MVEVIDIHKKYGQIEVLKGINFSIKKSEIVSLVGASGAGKSSLLQIIGTLDKPDQGQVLINQTNPFQISENELAKFRNKHIGFVFQFHNLLAEFTVLENILLPVMIAGNNINEKTEKAQFLMDFLGIGHKHGSLPAQLSGGEQQRVAVARALINDPDLVLADEPTGNLDSKNAQELHELFWKLRQELQQTFLIVTHNAELAQIADRKLTMHDGIIVA
jgi:lipoprotein-releasing system ATP-binding protein